MNNTKPAPMDDAFIGSELTIHLDRGPHRNLEISQTDRALLRTTISTSPGVLLITNDASTYVLACQGEDILNPERFIASPYWCARVLATDANYGHERFSAEKFRQVITDDYHARITSYQAHTHTPILARINEYLLFAGIETDAEAHEAVRGFDHRGFDYVGQNMHFNEPTPQFAWALRTIRWTLSVYQSAEEKR